MSLKSGPPHAWQTPPGSGNLWGCSGCNAVVCHDGPSSPSEHPYYTTPRAPGYSPVLEGHDVYCPCGCSTCSGVSETLRAKILEEMRGSDGALPDKGEFLEAHAKAVDEWEATRAKAAGVEPAKRERMTLPEGVIFVSGPEPEPEPEPESSERAASHGIEYKYLADLNSVMEILSARGCQAMQLVHEAAGHLAVKTGEMVEGFLDDAVRANLLDGPPLELLYGTMIGLALYLKALDSNYPTLGVAQIVEKVLAAPGHQLPVSKKRPEPS